MQGCQKNVFYLKKQLYMFFIEKKSFFFVFYVFFIFQRHIEHKHHKMKQFIQAEFSCR